MLTPGLPAPEVAPEEGARPGEAAVGAPHTPGSEAHVLGVCSSQTGGCPPGDTRGHGHCLPVLPSWVLTRVLSSPPRVGAWAGSVLLWCLAAGKEGSVPGGCARYPCPGHLGPRSGSPWGGVLIRETSEGESWPPGPGDEGLRPSHQMLGIHVPLASACPRSPVSPQAAHVHMWLGPCQPQSLIFRRSRHSS